MKKKKMYKYIGKNGNVLTEILLDQIIRYDFMKLMADEGKILKNINTGETYKATIAMLEDVEDWEEIDVEND